MRTYVRFEPKPTNILPRHECLQSLACQKPSKTTQVSNEFFLAEQIGVFCGRANEEGFKAPPNNHLAVQS